MTIKYAKGYINIGQYDGPGETASGKHYTQFSLSVKEPGESKRTYLRMRMWDGEYSDPATIIDGIYCLVEYDEKPYERQDGTTDYNRSVYRIWVPAEPKKSVENVGKTSGGGSLYDEDLPF